MNDEHPHSDNPAPAEGNGEPFAADDNSIRRNRLEKLAALRESGWAYPNDFCPTHYAAALCCDYAQADKSELEEQKITVSVAGRLILKRVMGRSIFFTLADDGAQIQLYAAKHKLDDTFDALRQLDIGDIVGCCGVLFRTNKGELTIDADSLRLLVKSLRPLPEKYHGLSDTQQRYRKRYVSLIVNQREREIFAIRHRVIAYLRSFFTDHGYEEVETPMLQAIPGGALARPFITHHNTLGEDFYLRIAQELYIKRLLVGGFAKVFELNRNFRNEGISTQHNPEFTMIEFNAAFQRCADYILLVEQLLSELVTHIHGESQITYQGQQISFAVPFAKMHLTEAIEHYHPEYRQAQLNDIEALRDILRRRDIPVDAQDSLGLMQLRLFEAIVEHQLIQPTFIVDYPAEVSPLSRRYDEDPGLTERFELFVAGRELVNGFSELNDPQLQASVFRQQAAQREEDDEAMHYDDDYIEALEYGLPPNAGGGIGVDRLVMLLADAPSIRDVILFPQMRREKSL